MSRYGIVSIEKSGTPQGAQDDNWFCYVIARPAFPNEVPFRNKIQNVGNRRGHARG